MGFIANAIGAKNRFNATAPTNSFQAQDIFGNAIQQGQANQADLIAQLQGAAAGQGPSLAQAQLQQATQAQQAQAAGAIASQRGINPALAARLISQQQAQIGQQSAGQSALTRLQEQLAARQQLGGAIQGQLGLNLQGQQGVQQLNQATAAQNASLNLGAQQINAGVAAQNAQTNAGIFGGVLGGLGAGAQMAFGKPPTPGMARGGAVERNPFVDALRRHYAWGDVVEKYRDPIELGGLGLLGVPVTHKLVKGNPDEKKWAAIEAGGLGLLGVPAIARLLKKSKLGGKLKMSKGGDVESEFVKALKEKAKKELAQYERDKALGALGRASPNILPDFIRHRRERGFDPDLHGPGFAEGGPVQHFSDGGVPKAIKELVKRLSNRRSPKELALAGAVLGGTAGAVGAGEGQRSSGAIRGAIPGALIGGGTGLVYNEVFPLTKFQGLVDKVRRRGGRVSPVFTGPIGRKNRNIAAGIVGGGGALAGGAGYLAGHEYGEAHRNDEMRRQVQELELRKRFEKLGGVAYQPVRQPSGLGRFLGPILGKTLLSTFGGNQPGFPPPGPRYAGGGEVQHFGFGAEVLEKLKSVGGKAKTSGKNLVEYLKKKETQSRALTGALAGGTIGGLYGLGHHDEGESRLHSGMVGALKGGATGALMRVIEPPMEQHMRNAVLGNPRLRKLFPHMAEDAELAEAAKYAPTRARKWTAGPGGTVRREAEPGVWEHYVGPEELYESPSDYAEAQARAAIHAWKAGGQDVSPEDIAWGLWNARRGAAHHLVHGPGFAKGGSVRPPSHRKFEVAQRELKYGRPGVDAAEDQARRTLDSLKSAGRELSLEEKAKLLWDLRRRNAIPGVHGPGFARGGEVLRNALISAGIGGTTAALSSKKKEDRLPAALASGLTGGVIGGLFGPTSKSTGKLRKVGELLERSPLSKHKEVFDRGSRRFGTAAMLTVPAAFGYSTGLRGTGEEPLTSRERTKVLLAHLAGLGIPFGTTFLPEEIGLMKRLKGLKTKVGARIGEAVGAPPPTENISELLKGMGAREPQVPKGLLARLRAQTQRVPQSWRAPIGYGATGLGGAGVGALGGAYLANQNNEKKFKGPRVPLGVAQRTSAPYAKGGLVERLKNALDFYDPEQTTEDVRSLSQRVAKGMGVGSDLAITHSGPEVVKAFGGRLPGGVTGDVISQAIQNRSPHFLNTAGTKYAFLPATHSTEPVIAHELGHAMRLEEGRPRFVSPQFRGGAHIPRLEDELGASKRALEYLVKEHGPVKGLVKGAPLVPAFGSYLRSAAENAIQNPHVLPREIEELKEALRMRRVRAAKKLLGFDRGGDVMEPQGVVPGKPKYNHNTLKNDTVPAELTPEEIVLPLSVTKSQNPPEAAARFVANIMKKKGVQHFQSGGEAQPDPLDLENSPTSDRFFTGNPEVDALLARPSLESERDTTAPSLTANPFSSPETAREVDERIFNVSPGPREVVPSYLGKAWAQHYKDVTGKPPTAETFIPEEIKKSPAWYSPEHQRRAQQGQTMLSAAPSRGMLATSEAQAATPTGAPTADAVPPSQLTGGSPGAGTGLPQSDYMGFGTLSKKLGEATEAEKQANLEMAGEKGRLGQTEADVLANQRDADMYLQIQQTNALKHLQDQTEQLKSDLANSKIDPNRFWASKSTAGKVSSIIGVILGGLGQGLLRGGPNQAIEMLNKQIDRDIEAQHGNLRTKAMLLEQAGLDSSRIMAQHQVEWLRRAAFMKNQLDEAASRSQSPQAMAAAQAANAALDKQMIPVQADLAMKQAMFGIQDQFSGPGIPTSVAMRHPEFGKMAVPAPGRPGYSVAAKTEKGAEAINDFETTAGPLLDAVNDIDALQKQAIRLNVPIARIAPQEKLDALRNRYLLAAKTHFEAGKFSPQTNEAYAAMVSDPSSVFDWLLNQRDRSDVLRKDVESKRAHLYRTYTNVPYGSSSSFGFQPR